MRRTRRRAVAGRLGRALGLGALLVPGLAEAQLLPNRTIRRERTPCAAENPYYKTVRQNYFGYYPTCWSRFPAGWGCPCPNPELPNFAASLAEKPIKPLPEDAFVTPDAPAGGDDVGPGPAVPGPADDRNGVAAPPLPNPRGGAFNGELTPSNPIVPPATGGAGSPPPPDGSPRTSRTAPSAKPEARPAAVSLLEVPRISPPDAPATALIAPTPPGLDAPAPAPDATLAGADAAPATMPITPTAAIDGAAPPSAELPAAPPLPDASTPPAQAPSVTPTALVPATSATTMPASVSRAMALPPAIDPAAAGRPAQAPQKKGILTGLFDRQNRKRR